MNAAYAPQATLNLHARHYRIIEDLLEADPRRIEAAHQEVSPVFEETFVAFGDPGRLVGQLAHNFAGRILAQIAVPAFDWGRRLHDQEALRRMIVLKREAKEHQIAPEGMDAFLSQQPEDLRNPFTGEPFGWSAETYEIHFVPSAANYWKRETLIVVY
ncbi:MAG: hypothetical protein IPK97_19030 [Ahniella sp.]|nr:hypothetical protein [Ahniella sp.]